MNPYSYLYQLETYIVYYCPLLSTYLLAVLKKFHTIVHLQVFTDKKIAYHNINSYSTPYHFVSLTIAHTYNDSVTLLS